MDYQEILLHGIALLMAGLFATNSHAEVPVVDAQGGVTSAVYSQEVNPQEYVAAQQGGKSNKTSDQELYSKIQALQESVQKLQGLLEVQSHDLQVLRSQQQAVYHDIDSRVSTLQAQCKQRASVAKPAGVISANNAAAPKNDAQGEAAYLSAYQLLQGKQYTQSIDSFQDFLRTYPESHYIPNVHYWLGELYLSQGYIDKAKTEFSFIITKFPSSTKLADAMLKLGFAYYDNGEWKEARSSLAMVNQKFPDTETSRLAQARLKDMDQQGL